MRTPAVAVRPPRPRVPRRDRVLLAVGVLALLAGCARGTDTAADAGTAPPAPTAPGTMVTEGTAPGTAVTTPATTEPATTTEAPTTAVPTVPPVPATIAGRPPRPRPAAPPGRLQPPADLDVPAPLVPDEGRWEPFGPLVGGAPAMWRADLRADPAGAYKATAVWIDSAAVRAELFPGTDEPGGSWSVAGAVPGPQVPELVGAFNGGFLLREAQGGFYKDGTTVDRLVDGTASLVFRADGSMTLGAWGRDVSMTDDVVGVRQNLPLLVDGHKPNPSATDTDTKAWGRTWGSIPAPWRSAIGMRDDGSFVYVGGPALTARALASTMVQLGADRAMALDLNPEWVTFNAYSSGAGTKFHPLQPKPANRYLTPDMRDFVALFARS